MREPIESRELLFDTLRDGSIYFLDWCLVNTPLGAMLEPRSLVAVDPGKVINSNAYDQSFSRITPMKEDVLFSIFNTSGRQVPLDFSAD